MVQGVGCRVQGVGCRVKFGFSGFWCLKVWGGRGGGGGFGTWRFIVLINQV